MTTTSINHPLHLGLDRLLGPQTAGRIATELNITTTGALLDYFPRRWIERGELTPISSLPVGEHVTVVAKVLSVTKRQMRSRKGFIVEVVVTDQADDSMMSMAFFNGWDALKRLSAGAHAIFHGKTSLYRHQLTLNNPEFSILSTGYEDVDTANATLTAADLAPVPVYPATAKLPTWTIRTCIEMVLDAINWDVIEDPVPAELLVTQGNLPHLGEAYTMIHRPETIDEAHRARRRFALQEAVILQTLLAQRRTAYGTERTATAYPVREHGIRTALDEHLPFSLTAGQREAGDQLAAELNSTTAMSRLLQGEVGSGKTLVALRAMAQVVDSGAQAVLVAPTEVLATQHYQSITTTLGPLATAGQLSSYTGPATEVVLLTGSMTTAQTKQALLKIASGQAGIVIGTHALFSDQVSFAELGLIVIDEQHRFGVDQRETLREDHPGAHMLVMTATPIPRSVAMTVFGDLNITLLHGLPSGRQPVETHVARMAHGPQIIGRVWEIIAEEVAAGHQAFIVCPKIDPPDPAEQPASTELADPAYAASVTEMAHKLPQVSVFDRQQVRFGMVHGRQDADTQRAVMQQLVAGEIDVLVSTTVIEVGVDIPNATVMAILDAESFGLSTLHQLRGRVGRGRAAARCFLATRLPDHHPSLDRLAVLAATQDGFEIARADVEQRGEGDVLGATQHGYSSRLRVLRVIRDEDLIVAANNWIAPTLERDPTLQHHPALAHAVDVWDDEHAEGSAYLVKN
ncbi:ATP-dependent DNA helicase RecG [Auritidibacter ignavus]|uniref:ATP-dependent DNA helicase RecG n=1 Tax=Auritidibacter ignavus TaxID=678932 RepID=UPI002FE690D1